MHLPYTRISKYPYNFRTITGLSIKTFDKLIIKVRPIFQELESSKLRHGQMSHLPTLEDKLLCILMYYRTYIRCLVPNNYGYISKDVISDKNQVKNYGTTTT
ncbi:hypothetical protein Aasi_0349 [Candidatus Amoebophilus asiaticus 5a2]|uniref:Transposase Helix-turn-helix domain-containing protein n=1 Tax=Amoebophilus asiaticus (strain 5a2) TaxID=452471 RepID=B3ERC2_AMOA5|nr:hypothetical protein Aasi_0349 [Candidatus Amoebophilus asiaticus 5a2]